MRDFNTPNEETGPAIPTLVTGGVVSSVGKGIVAASVGRILKARGHRVAILKLDPAPMLLAFGVAQLVCGPLADRFGRRPVLLTGLACYTAAAAGCALAGSADALVAWRAKCSPPRFTRRPRPPC